MHMPAGMRRCDIVTRNGEGGFWMETGDGEAETVAGIEKEWNESPAEAA